MGRYTGASGLLYGWMGRIGHPILGWLIVVNAGVYLLGVFLRLLGWLLGVGADQALFHLLALPASFGMVGTRPWTLVSYMFFHQDLLHILFNMLWLVAFGQIFLSVQPAYRLRNAYLLGGIGGGLLYMLVYNVVPYFSGVLPSARALGASAAVMAVTISAALYRPDMRVLLYGVFPVKVKWIALVAVGVDMLSVSGHNAGGHIAHLGGALVGWLYVRSLGRGAYLDRPFDWLSAQWSRVSSFRRRPRGQGGAVSQGRMDAILRKLARSGYGSLTREEKELLFRRR